MHFFLQKGGAPVQNVHTSYFACIIANSVTNYFIIWLSSPLVGIVANNIINIITMEMGGIDDTLLSFECLTRDCILLN